MCCEICPRYTNCEEEDNIVEMCCTSCRDYQSCHGKEDGGHKAGLDDELEEI